MIRAKTVRSPDGTAWVVRRRWAPRPRWRRIVRLPRLRSTPPVERPKLRWYELLDPFELVTDFPVVIAVIALVIFMIFIGVPLLIFLVETLLVIPILLVTGLVTRIFWGRPWDIEATSALASERRAVWRVAGWRASDRAAARMISVLRASGDVASETPADLVVPSALRRPVR